MKGLSEFQEVKKKKKKYSVELEPRQCERSDERCLDSHSRRASLAMIESVELY